MEYKSVNMKYQLDLSEFNILHLDLNSVGGFL